MIIVGIFKKWFLHPKAIVIMHFCISHESVTTYSVVCNLPKLLLLVCIFRSVFISLKIGSEVIDSVYLTFIWIFFQVLHNVLLLLSI